MTPEQNKPSGGDTGEQETLVPEPFIYDRSSEDRDTPCPWCGKGEFGALLGFHVRECDKSIQLFNSIGVR